MKASLQSKTPMTLLAFLAGLPLGGLLTIAWIQHSARRARHRARRARHRALRDIILYR